jgi:predicted metal-dependent peptidase
MDASKIFKDIIIESPFYGIFLSMINKNWDSVDTVRVVKKGINYELSMSEKYFNSITLNNAKAHILHEVIHIALLHPLRIKDYSNKKLAHLAMDIVVNQYVNENYWLNCPTKFMTLAKLNEILASINYELAEEHKSIDYYLEKLNSLPTGDSDQFAVGEFEEISTTPEWNDFYSMSDVDDKLLQKVTEGMLTNARDAVSKSRGRVPGELGSIFELIDKEEPPKFNWKAYLRNFVGYCMSADVKTTRTKENVRYPEAAGKKIKQMAHILVAIDTSQSVNDTLLEVFLAELKHINQCGTEVDIMQCDAKGYPVRPIKEYVLDNLVRIEGRGGTDFNPPVNYYAENQPKYQALIYFTDGECSPPDLSPNNILWLIPDSHSLNDLLPGTVKQISL